MTCAAGKVRATAARAWSRDGRRTRIGAGGRRRGARACTILVMCCLTATLSTASRARDDGDEVSRSLSSARQALIMGDAAEAARLYRDILDAHPDDLRAFWGLVGAYSAAGMDRDHLVPLLVSRIEGHPEDLRARKELGAAYARLGERARAHETWIETLHHGRPEGALYLEIGSLETAHGMVEEAVETYIDGRRAFGSPSLYARELVQAYTLLGEYGKAVDECVVAVVERPGLIQWAVNRVEAMLDRGVPRREIEERMLSLASNGVSGAAEAGFAGSVLLVLGFDAEARDAFLRADDAATDQGRTLLEYAAVMSEAGRQAEARDLYRSVVERHPGTVNAAMAAVEAGLILAREGRVDEALTELKAVGDGHPGHAAGGQALLAAARLELTEKRAPAAALETADLLVGTWQRGDAELVREARLLKSDAYLALGRFEESHAEAESVLSGRTRAATRERAMFNMGFASFLMSEGRAALDEFRTMVEANTSGQLANDALRLMLIIAEGEDELGPEPAALLASAHAARLRGDAAAALERLDEIASRYGGSAAASEALLLGGAIADEAGDRERALEIYRRITDEAPMVTARAEAMMRSGDILFEKMGRRDASLEAYAAILEELPENALSGEARRKIETVRRSAGRSE